MPTPDKLLQKLASQSTLSCYRNTFRLCFEDSEQGLNIIVDCLADSSLLRSSVLKHVVAMYYDKPPFRTVIVTILNLSFAHLY